MNENGIDSIENERIKSGYKNRSVQRQDIRSEGDKLLIVIQTRTFGNKKQ